MANNLRKRISDSLDFPKDVIMDVPSMHLIGNNEIIIENHKGIVEYTQRILKLNSKLGKILINGDEIKIIEISQDEIWVNGLIYSIEFITNKED